MKSIVFFAAIIIFAVSFVSGQNTKQNHKLEQEIRKLEQGQVDALLRNDLAAMKANWAKDYVVNNPFNEAVDAAIAVLRIERLTSKV